MNNGEHKAYFMLDPASQQLGHMVECFRSSLQLPVNRIARLGRGKGFPYPTMFLHPVNIQGITLNTRAWLVLKDINKENTKKCKEIADKLTSIQFTKRCPSLYICIFFDTNLIPSLSKL